MYGSDKYTLFFLKISVILPLAYAGVMALWHPNDWISFVPAQVGAYVEPALFLKAFSIFELVLALVILWGRALTLTAILAGCILIGISVLNYKVFDIFFRDLGLACSAIALAIFSYRR